MIAALRFARTLLTIELLMALIVTALIAKFQQCRSEWRSNGGEDEQRITDLLHKACECPTQLCAYEIEPAILAFAKDIEGVKLEDNYRRFVEKLLKSALRCVHEPGRRYESFSSVISRDINELLENSGARVYDLRSEAEKAWPQLAADDARRRGAQALRSTATLSLTDNEVQRMSSTIASCYIEMVQDEGRWPDPEHPSTLTFMEVEDTETLLPMTSEEVGSAVERIAESAAGLAIHRVCVESAVRARAEE